MEQTKKGFHTLISIGLCLVLAGYAFVLVKIILLKYGWGAGLRSVNLIPFLFVGDLLHPSTSLGVVLKNVLGNLAIFIPLGMLAPALWKRFDAWWKPVLLGLAVSAAFELTQYLFGLGASDVDDLLLNTLGAAIGSGLYFGVCQRLAGSWKPRLCALAFLCAFGLLGVLSLWLFAPGELPRVIERVNEQALDGLDTDAYAYSGVPARIGEDAVVFTTTYARHEDGAVPPTQWKLSKTVGYYHCALSYQFSPNGNIQKTICTYERLDAPSAQKLIAENENVGADIFVDASGNCTALLLTTYQD